MAAASIVVYSDFTCPFSYVTEAALRRLVGGAGSGVEYRAYELYPSPVPLPGSAGDQAVIAALAPLAAEVDVRVSPRSFVPRTRKAHEAARFARERQREDALRAAIFRAYWEEGRDIGRIDVLSGVAGEVGLEAEAVRIALDIDVHADEVARERAAAERRGVRHTPTLLLGGEEEPLVVVGAHPLSELRAMLERHPGPAAPET